MSVRLESVAFDHGRPGGSVSARRNYHDPVQAPEWTSESCTAGDSPVIYAADRTGSGAVTIDVALRRAGLVGESVEVRAIEGASQSSGLSDAPRVPHLLGPVEQKLVDFGGLDRVVETFRLPAHRLASAAIGIHDVSWRWEVRPAREAVWKRIGESEHRIYAVLGVPSAPWVTTPRTVENTQLVWTDVLDYACRWATGAATLDAAAARITEAVRGLGPEVLEYGCPIIGVTEYSWPYFFCTELLELLDGKGGRGRFVNCSDCATIVSTFANALGCDLWQSRMFGASPFALNPTVAIGIPGWQAICGWTVFNFHEVAWKGDCGADDEVFDACLLLDSSGPPGASRIPVLPVNMRFGEAGEGGYRDRIAAPAGRANCLPQPSSRRRRIVV